MFDSGFSLYIQWFEGISVFTKRVKSTFRSIHVSKKASFVPYVQRPSKKGATNDMGKYSTKQAECVQKIETLGGDYALKWDDETQMGVNAHAALLSQFAKAGGFFDRLVETCPMRLTSNNAPEVRDLIATVMVSMVNGATRFRHFDRLHGDGGAVRRRAVHVVRLRAAELRVHPGGPGAAVGLA